MAGRRTQTAAAPAAPVDPLIAALEAEAEDLVQAGPGKGDPVPVTVRGVEYPEGIATVPLEVLPLMSKAERDLLTQSEEDGGYGYTSKQAAGILAARTKRLQDAAADGTFTADQVRALIGAGILRAAAVPAQG